MSRTIREYIPYFLISLLGGLCVACSYALTANGEVDSHILSLPAVIPIAAGFGLLGGAIVSPFVYFCLRNKNLFVAAVAIITLMVIATGAANIAMSPAIGLPGAYVMSFILLLLWRLYGPESPGRDQSS
jgi:uncharacterized protein involved in response to NO